MTTIETNPELIDLLEELTSFPAETEWIEFKMGKGSISDEQIGEYISAMSNGATIANKPFGYMPDYDLSQQNKVILKIYGVWILKK